MLANASPPDFSAGIGNGLVVSGREDKMKVMGKKNTETIAQDFSFFQQKLRVREKTSTPGADVGHGVQ